MESGSTASLETVMLPGGKGEKWFQPVFSIAHFWRGGAFLFPDLKNKYLLLRNLTT
jgi:hypothetical protein